MPDIVQRSLKKFGPFGEILGVRIVEWELDYCKLELDVEDRHLNGLGVVHGGVISTLIDMSCTHSGLYCTVPGNSRSGMTASLTVNLMGPVHGGRITAIARRRGGGKTLFMSSGEVFDQDGELVAIGESVGRYARGSGVPEGQPSDDQNPWIGGKPGQNWRTFHSFRLP